MGCMCKASGSGRGGREDQQVQGLGETECVSQDRAEENEGIP